MAGRRLKLVRKQLTEVNYQYLGAFRLRIEVSDPNNSGADPHVFLYLQRPVNPYDGTVLSDLMAVASPVDMSEYPVGEPRDGTTYPIFRLDYIEIDLRSTLEAKEAWLSVVLQVDQLIRALDRMEELVVVEETFVGDVDDSGNSGNSGNSASKSESNSNSNSESQSQSHSASASRSVSMSH